MRPFLRVTALAALLVQMGPSEAWAGKPSVADTLIQQHLETEADRSVLVTALERALEDAKGPKDSLDIMLHLGEQLRLDGRLEDANARFVEVANHPKAGALVPAAQLGLTLVAMERRGHTDADSKALTTLDGRSAPSTMNAHRHLALAKSANMQASDDLFREHSAKALVYAVADPAVESSVSARLDALSRQEADGTDGPTPLDDADQALHAGDASRAMDIANAVLAESSPGKRIHRAAAATLQRANGTRALPLAVLLLPLEDERYSAVARQLQEAFEFGYQAEEGEWEVRVVDSGSDEESVAKAIDAAVVQDGASVLIGPLLTAQAISAAEASEAMRTPLLSLSKGIADASEYGFVFQMSTTLANEVEALVAHAMEKEEMRTFAAFAPQTPYGERAVALFVEATKQRGGDVTVIDFYDPTTTDLLSDAQELGRKDYEARRDEFREVKKLIEEEGGDPTKAVLPPVIDFQAIFLPERASRVPLACAALAYEEFPMGDFQPIPDSPAIPLLGLSGWNQAKLTQSGGPYVRGSRFVDIYAMPIEDGRWSFTEEEARLNEGYRETFGRTITSLEASTIDVGMYLAQALRSLPEDPSPADVRDALAGHSMTASLTRLSGIDPVTHHATRELRVLTMDSVEIFPAPQPEVDPAAADTVD